MATDPAYNFDEQLRKGIAGEETLDRYFRQWFVITRAIREEQRQGIDRWFMPQPFGAAFSVEYKTDTTAARTHNAFVETVSVDITNKPGWAYSSQAQYLAYYIPGDELLYVISLSVLRTHLPRWTKQYPSRAIRNDGYCTHGLLVELREFEALSDCVYSL